MSALEIPYRLDTRPKWKGLPIPAITFLKSNGEPDFRVTDTHKRMAIIAHRHCQLCGWILGRNMFFVGGTAAAKDNLYFEPGAHLDCLLYAMQVCPFIAGNMQHASIADIQADNPDTLVTTDLTYSPEKSDWWVIVKAGGFKQLLPPDGVILLQPHPVLGKTPPLKPTEMNADQWACIARHLKSNPVPYTP